MADKFFQVLQSFDAEYFVGHVRPGQADNRELLRQQFVACQVVECRHEFPFCQVPRGTEDDHDAGPGRLAGLLVQHV